MISTNNCITIEFASKFAEQWIDSWNSHDLERVLRHYAPEIEFTSPFVRSILGVDTEMVRGLDSLRHYFGKAFLVYPNLKLVPLRVYTSLRSLVIEYESVNGRLAAEMLEFNDAKL